MALRFPRLTVSLLVFSNLLFVTLQVQVLADDIPEFSYLDHPTHKRNRVRVYPTPVPMFKYHFRTIRNILTSEEAIFVPGGASYTYVYATGEFAQSADVLATPAKSLARSSVNAGDFATIRLNYPVRVYVLLEVRSPPRSSAQLTLESAPSDWIPIAVVETADGAEVPLGDSTRWGSTPRPSLGQYAIAVEVPLLPDNSVVLPHPRGLTAGGRNVIGMSIVFGPANSVGFPLTAQAAPSVPGSHNSYVENIRFNPSSDVPRPNQECPKWLHDSYVINDRVTNAAWLTWHPMIDPVYWCYFNHEHGAYPGRYRPKFHYTASLTPDSSSATGRQIESHNGFKVMTFKVDDGRIVVMTLHAHNSEARRFVARHHTFVIAVFQPRPNRWIKQMELHMKMDFGFLEGLLAGVDGPIDGEGYDIKHELQSTSGETASRQVYTYNPENPDPFFWLSSDPFVGRYEEWRAPMNCADNLDHRFNSGFKFEFHNQQTAMKCAICTSDCTCTSRGDNDNLTVLKGHGLQRSIVFVASSGTSPGETHQRIELSEAHCSFQNDADFVNRGTDGVFYTNSYFNEVLPSSDPLAVYQFLQKGFTPIVAGGYRAVTNDDPWSQTMSYAPGMTRRNFNTEMAVNRMVN